MSASGMGREMERERDADPRGRRSELESQLQPRGMLSSQPLPPPIPASFLLHFNKCCLIMHCRPRAGDAPVNKTWFLPPGGQSSLGLSFLICRMGHPYLPGPLHRAIVRILGSCSCGHVEGAVERRPSMESGGLSSSPRQP